MADQIPDWARDVSAPAAAPAPAPKGGAASPDWAQDATAPVSKPFKDEDFPEYQRLVRARGTTPEQLSNWLEQRGYGRSTNAAEVLAFQRKNPRSQILNTYTQNPADPAPAPQPDGMPQPGTPTDWLPDFIQAPVERAGLALGIIDPKTYYGLGNYGENARAPNRPTTVSNTPVPTWTERVVRSAGESFSPAGGSVASIFKRANADVADDDAIRHYGSQNNWTGQQIDDAIARARADRARAVKEQRDQWAIRDADEARREDGGKPTWLGWARRGSADLVGAGVADGPLLLAAPKIKGAEAVAPVLGRVAGKISEAAAPVVERFVAKVAPSAAGQAAVQGATDVASQTSEVQAGIKDHYDPVQTVVRASLGAAIPVAGSAAKPLVGSLAKGAGNVAGKLADVAGNASDALSSRFNGMVSKTYTRLAADAENLARTYEANGDAAGAASARSSAEAYRTRAQEVSSVDPALPAGMTPRDVARATKQLAGIQLEANNFKGTPEPKAEDVFPADASRAADAEAWGKSLGAPEPAPVEAAPEPAPVAEPGPTDMTPQPSKAEFSSEPAPAEPAPISRKEADAQFSAETGKPQTQTPAQWGKSLEEQAAAFKAAKEAGSPEPAPSPATRNATAEAPPVEEPTVATPAAAAEPAAPADDVVTRLIDALSAAGKARPKQDELYSAERSARLAKAREALKTGGVAGYRQALAVLQGELPKADFEAVAPKFSPEDMYELVNRVATSPKLQGYEPFGALQGLDKLMNGKLPAANELALLGRVFDEKFLKAALTNRTRGQKTMNLFSQVWNLPRSIVSTIDASIPLRQGVFMVSRPEFYTSFGKMLKQMGSQKYFDATQEAIRARPNFQLMDESGLAIHNKRMLETRPEQFRSDWAGKIPVFKHLYHISERGAEGFSNQLRADVFDRFVAQYQRVGVNLAEKPELARKVANYINTATGRGKVPFDKVGTAVGDIFFSPQLMSSRIQLATLPARIIAEKDPVLRGNMIRDLVGFSSIAGTVIALAKLNGAEVNDNPLSTDWGKIKVPKQTGAAGAAQMAPALVGVGVQSFKGETRYDIFGGMQQYLHLAAVLAMNERTTTNGRTIEFGKGYKPETRASTIARFLRSKESPVASFINDALEGSDYMGNKFELRKALLSRLTPFSAQDLVTGYSPDTQAGPGKAAPVAPAPAPKNMEVPDWAK